MRAEKPARKIGEAFKSRRNDADETSTNRALAASAAVLVDFRISDEPSSCISHISRVCASACARALAQHMYLRVFPHQ
jgi:hypothetical protein